MPGTYLDFDLLIEHAGQGYRAKVLDSPSGQAAADFALPFSSQDMEIFLLRVTRSLSEARRRVRRLESQERELAKGFGGELFQAMFSGPVIPPPLIGWLPTGFTLESSSVMLEP